MEVYSPLKDGQGYDDLKYEMLMTSKENFYAIGRQLWYDGEVASGTFSTGQLKRIQITHAIQTNFIRHCSKESYFEALAKQYISANLTKYKPSYKFRLANGTFKTGRCDYRDLCLPISLPLPDIPLCNISTLEQEKIKQDCSYKALEKQS